MKMTDIFNQNKQNSSYYDFTQSRVDQPGFQARKRFNSTLGVPNKSNQIKVSPSNFRKSLVYQNKQNISNVCPQSGNPSGYGQLNSILKELQLPKSNRASKNMISQFSNQNQYTVGKYNDNNGNRTYQDLKMDLCDLMLKKNKSRQKYQDIVRKFGDGSQSIKVDTPPLLNKKSSNFLELPLGSFGNPNINMHKAASMTQRSPAKSPMKGEYSPYIKASKFPFNQKVHQIRQIEATIKSNYIRQTLDVNQKDQFELKRNSNRQTLDSYTKEKISYKIPEKLNNFKTKSQKSNVSVDDFMMTKKLGQGKFGEVFRAIHKQTYTLYALKRIKKSAIKTYLMEDQMMMQIKLQLFFNHPNILKLYAMFDDETYIYLLLEYMEEGTLFSKLKKSGVLKEDQTSKIMYDVLKGVSYLHENDIAHRDIKPQNIVVSYGVCKLCDFGWSAICKDDRRTTMCGTLDYSAPEIIEGKEYSKTIDLWCLGVMTFELMIGKAPFYHINRKQTMKKIINENHEQLKFPSTISQKAKDFISKFLLWQPQNRIEANKALKESFITDHNEQ